MTEHGKASGFSTEVELPAMGTTVLASLCVELSHGKLSLSLPLELISLLASSI